jgi:plastocyanin
MGTRARRGIAGVLFIGAGAVAALSSATAIAAAATAVSISSGGCSGGGSSYCFTPESANANAGDSVTWTNQSGVGHTVTSCTSTACPGAAANTGSQTFDSPVSSGSTASVTFTAAGTYIYYCRIHGYAAMHGTVTVAAAATSAPASQAPATQAPASQAPSSGGGVAATVPSTGADLAPNLLVGAVLVSLGGLALRWRRRAT